MLSENEGREICMNCGNIQSIPGRSKCDVCGNGDLGIVVTSQIDQDIRDQMERERMGEIEADQAIRDEVMMGIDQALRDEVSRLDAIELDKAYYQSVKDEQAEAEVEAILFRNWCIENPLP